MIRSYKKYSETFVPKDSNRRVEARNKGVFFFNDREEYELEIGVKSKILMTCLTHNPPSWMCSFFNDLDQWLIYLATLTPEQAETTDSDFKFKIQLNEDNSISIICLDWPSGMRLKDPKKFADRAAKEMVNDLDTSGYYGSIGKKDKSKYYANILSAVQKYEKADQISPNILSALERVQNK